MKLKEFVLGLLVPEFCQNCQRLGPLLCQDCYHSLEFYFEQNFRDEMAKRFTTVYPDEVLIMGRLNEGLAKLTKNLKYQSCKNLAPFLAKMFYRHLSIPSANYLIFVPLHPLKLRQRGYNQCQEIALTLGQLLQLPVLDLLTRQRYLSPQARVSQQKERLERLNGVFAIREDVAPLVKNKHILLLDDVLTSGATLNETSRLLKAAGARRVTGLILASKAK